jgi:hypothetical protein
MERVDAVLQHAANGGLDDEGLVLGMAEQAPPAGEVACDRVAGGNAEGVVGGCEDDADKFVTLPARHRTRSAGGVGCGKEVQRIGEHILLAERMPQRGERLPDTDEITSVSQDLASD